MRIKRFHLAKKKPRQHYRKKWPLVDREHSEPARVEPVLAETVLTKPAWKFDRIMAEEVSALLLLPLLAFWVMRFVPINQEQFIDPYVYTGYIHNFRDLIARFDVTYYSVRFGLILPA